MNHSESKSGLGEGILTPLNSHSRTALEPVEEGKSQKSLPGLSGREELPSGPRGGTRGPQGPQGPQGTRVALLGVCRAQLLLGDLHLSMSAVVFKGGEC